ncbi:STAS domain-containing protein [Cryptosporangium japonicum]|uniref:STAS domain-containing protein n=1 Tax=Cryptosporangium japonicum TaxID=80872 RepID=UPI0031CF1806
MSHPSADAARIALTGALDRTAAPLLIETVEHTLAPGGLRSIVLDLTEVRFLDVGGVRAVTSARRCCDAMGCWFELANPSPFVQRVLRIAGQWRGATDDAGRDPAGHPHDDGRQTSRLVPEAHVLRRFHRKAEESAGATRGDDASRND